MSSPGKRYIDLLTALADRANDVIFTPAEAEMVKALSNGIIEKLADRNLVTATSTLTLEEPPRTVQILSDQAVDILRQLILARGVYESLPERDDDFFRTETVMYIHEGRLGTLESIADAIIECIHRLDRSSVVYVGILTYRYTNLFTENPDKRHQFTLEVW